MWIIWKTPQNSFPWNFFHDFCRTEPRGNSLDVCVKIIFMWTDLENFLLICAYYWGYSSQRRDSPLETVETGKAVIMLKSLTEIVLRKPFNSRTNYRINSLTSEAFRSFVSAFD